MKVAFDARSLASGVPRGWDRYTIGLVGELARRGVSVTLLHRAGAPPHRDLVAGLPCETLAVPGVRGLWWEQVELPRALARGRFDIYHAPAEHGVPLLSPCPVALTVHSATHHSYADLIRRGLLPGALSDYLDTDHDPNGLHPAVVYWQAQVARADCILTPSEFSREEIVRLLAVSSDRVSVTPLGLAEQFLREPSPAAARQRTLAALGVRPPYLLFVGGYERHKNVAGLLATYARLRERQPGLSLVLVGSSDAPPELMRRARDLGLRPGEDVVFLSRLTAELTDLYDAAEIFVTLSWRESFCLPALEAMARGVPVVASAWGAAPEVVDGAGVLVDPRDEAAATDAILALLTSPDRAGIGARAKERAREFSWERTAVATLQVYERLATTTTRTVPH